MPTQNAVIRFSLEGTARQAYDLLDKLMRQVEQEGAQVEALGVKNPNAVDITPRVQPDAL